MAVPYKLNYFEIETGIDSTSTFIHTGDLTATKVKKYLATSNDILLGDGTTTSLSGLQPAGNYITALTGEATATGPGSVAITLTNSAVIGKVLTGLSITGSAIASTDTILQAFGKIQNQINGKQNTLTLTTTGSSGSSTFIADVLNVPTYTLSGLGGVPTSRQLTINGTAYDLSADRSWSVGTVTSVAALTLGTTGTDLSSTVANSTTTPVITLNVPTASAANRGALSAADWTTFNSKQDAITLTTTGSSGASTFISNTLNVPTYTLSGLGGVPTTRQLTINGTSYDLSADRSWSVGTVTSVGITMPAAFSVASSPVTSAGTIAITGAGLASQYIRGDGALGDFPNTGGGGSSVSYYLNGSVSQGTIGGNAYYEMNKTPVIGTGTDFSIAADGYIAQFITDANDPASLLIPGGNWNVEMYFSASSSGGTPSFYVEVYKYDGSTFTLLGSSATTPEGITNGTAIDIYYTSVGIPETVLTITDRLAIRVYVTHSGRTITLHTEDNHLSEIVTTFSNGLTALNGLTKQVQFLAVGTSGTDFNISSSVDTHTFNIPSASATARGVISTGTQTIAGTKTFNDNISVSTSTANSAIQATSTKADGRGLAVLATSSVEPFTVTQLGAGKLAEFVNSTGPKFTIYNGGTFEAQGATLYGNLDGTTATFTGLLTGATATFTNSGAGIGVGVTNSGSGDGIKITHSLGRAFRIESSSTGFGIIINNLTASTSAPFTIQKQGSTVITMSDTGAANFTGQLTLGSTITNGTYTYTLPSATGTLALTSALSSYLPLSGGTLTGALSGTSATFSGNGAFNTTSAVSNYSLDVRAATNKRVGVANSNSLSGANLLFYTDANAFADGYIDATKLILQSNSGGNVLIGGTTSTNSVAKTQIFGSTTASTNNGQLRIVDSSTTTKTLSIGMDGANSVGFIASINDGIAYLPLSLNPNGGNVGIGTTSPSALLHLSAATPAIYIDDTSTSGTRTRFRITSGDIGTTQAALFQFDNTSGTNLITTMVVNELGNVGIGTTSPTQPLEVRTGTDKILQILASGDLQIQSINDAKTANVPLNIVGSTLALKVGATTALSIASTGAATFSSANTNSVVDILTLYNPSQTSSGVRQLFNNGYGNLAAIKVSQIDNGAGADDGKIEFQTATNAVLSTKLTITETGAATFSSSVTATTGLTVGSLASGSDAIISLANNASGGTRTIYYKASTASVNFTSTGAADLMMLSNGGVLTINNLGTGTVQATAGVLSVISDSKAKDKTGLFDGSALNAINKIEKPQYWNYNAKSELGESTYSVKQFGLFADDIHEVLGEEFAPTQTQSVYNEETKETKVEPILIDGSISYSMSDRALLSLAIQAIQELKAEIDLLKGEPIIPTDNNLE